MLICTTFTYWNLFSKSYPYPFVLSFDFNNRIQGKFEDFIKILYLTILIAFIRGLLEYEKIEAKERFKETFCFFIRIA